MVFPQTNLPPAAQPWATEVQSQLIDINNKLNTVDLNTDSRDAAIRANYQTTGVVQTALEDTLTYLRSLTFRYATLKSNAVWSNSAPQTSEATISGTEFYINLERRPKAASAFITVTCDVDLSCKDSAGGAYMQQNVSQYIRIQSYTGNPGTGAHGTTNTATGQYADYLIGKSTTKSGIQSGSPVSQMGGSNITTTAGVYLNPAYTYRITTRLRRFTSAGSSNVTYGGNVSPQTMTIQITP